MTRFRFLRLAAALLVAGTLVACNTTPGMPMGSTAGMSMVDQNAKMDMSKMDAQMKKMREMHEKMAAAKAPEERNKLIAEHMMTMQDGMEMMGGMGGMGGAGRGDKKSMSGMSVDMPAHHQMMDKRMAMMESMMQMMMDRMSAAPAR